MAIAEHPAELTVGELARMMREATKDQSFLDTPLGREVRRYLNAKRKELSKASQRDYEGSLHKLVLQFADLSLADFELPAGADLIEPWMDDRWGDREPGTFNTVHSHLRSFFDWHVLRGNLTSNPMALVGRARKPQPWRFTYSEDQCRAIVASTSNLRDNIAVRLMLYHGLRKGEMRKIQFKHFDFARRRLTVFGKGGKVTDVPLPEPAFWNNWEQHILEVGAEPDDYLMCVVKPIPCGKPDKKSGKRATREVRLPGKAMADTTMQRWWYEDILIPAGIVPPGTTSGKKMHAARHTAGQRMLDQTGNLKATQQFLRHASIQTTADVYTNYEIAQLTGIVAGALEGVEDD